MECEAKIVRFKCFVVCCGCTDCWTLRSTSLLHTKANASILGARYVISSQRTLLLTHSHSRNSFFILSSFVSWGTSFHSHTLKKFFFFLLFEASPTKLFNILHEHNTQHTTHSVSNRRLAVFHGMVGEFLSSNRGKFYEKERGWIVRREFSKSHKKHNWHSQNITGVSIIRF